MTEVRFSVIQGVTTSFEMKGHADFSDGEDIVCAAVSSCAYMVANTITEIYGIDAEIEVDDGYFFLSLSLEDGKKCSELLKGFELHINALAEQYPKNILCKKEIIS